MKKNILEIQEGDGLHNIYIDGNLISSPVYIVNVDQNILNGLTYNKSPPVCIALTSLVIDDWIYGIFATSKKALLKYNTEGTSINVGNSEQIQLKKASKSA